MVKKKPSRVWIENISPRVNDGRFPIKRTLGETVEVRSDVFSDGHDSLQVVLRYKRRSRRSWSEVPMVFQTNDRWSASFKIEEFEPYSYTVAAWIDTFSTLKHAITKKLEAEQDVGTELEEVAEELQKVGAKGPKKQRLWVQEGIELLDDMSARDRALLFLNSEELAQIVRSYGPRRALEVADRVYHVWVDRELARFSTWYEMFPRSAGTDPTRSATFKEAENRLPDIAEMGFDVLYLPPIHPIGESFRKGKNNSVTCTPGEPGSPWAIGSKDGGHKAVDPALGSIADFKKFVGRADALGIKVALDLAFQCSPDHPYVEEHPEWFRKRPDGSIHYAENPPKKYQDIYPLYFESEDWSALWEELKSVVEHWIACGVKIFRVDNPHTKPFLFWEWLIDEIHKKYPRVIFLSEAFTRPKVMNALAKLGFTQSYTYFTWRNNKQELTEYVHELTQGECKDYFRPNFFANTPDILHEYLQHGGPPAFKIRLILAATLSATYGIYSGFELCENEAGSRNRGIREF